MKDSFTVSVLDHGYVKYVGHLGSDESVIESARMSTNKGFQDWEKDANLLDYLYRNKHSSPFEMCDLVIEVQAPIFVFREWHRHRTQSFNEFSARYTKMPDLHYIPNASRIKKQAKHNQQASANETLDYKDADGFIQSAIWDQAEVYRHYEQALDTGIARELARINTPVSRYSKMRAKSNLRNWFHFLDLRMRENAQYEIREYANAVSYIIKELFPRSYSLFEEYDLYAQNMSRTEMKILKQLLIDNVDADKYKQKLQEAGINDPNRLDQCLNKFYK